MDCEDSSNDYEIDHDVGQIRGVYNNNHSTSVSDLEWAENKICSHPILATRTDPDPKKIYCICLDMNGDELFGESKIFDRCVKMEFAQNNMSFIPIDSWRSMGDIISNCKRLEEIYLEYMELTAEVAEALFRRNGPYEFPLSKLSFVGNGLGPREIEVVVPFLKSFTRIGLLDLRKNRIGNDGAQALANALDEIPVKSLILSDNQITLDGMSRILSSRSSTLTCLHLDRNEIGNDGIELLAQFFRQGGIALEELKIGRLNRFNVTWAKVLLESLHDNKWMKEIHFVGLGDADHMILHNAAKNLVCDTSSFDAFCKSNHIFQKLVSCRYRPFHSLHYAFRINASSHFSINKKLRCKLRSIYFHHDFDVEPFLSMKISLIPNVLGFLSRSNEFISNENDKGNLNGMYRFVRNWNIPDLCIFPPPEVKIKILKSENAKLKCSLNTRIKQLEGEVSRLERLQRDSNQRILQLEIENQLLSQENEENRLRKGDKSIKRRNM